MNPSCHQEGFKKGQRGRFRERERDRERRRRKSKSESEGQGNETTEASRDLPSDMLMQGTECLEVQPNSRKNEREAEEAEMVPKGLTGN